MYGVIAAVIVAVVILDAADLFSNFGEAGTVIAPPVTVAGNSALIHRDVSAFAVDPLPAEFVK
jgi:hypothetical protein